MNKIGVTSSGTVIVEMSESQYSALSSLSVGFPPSRDSQTEKANLMSPSEKLDFVRPRLAKLKPKRRGGVVKSISAMFQFTGGIDEKDIDRIIESLAKEGYLKIGSDEKVEYKAK